MTLNVRYGTPADRENAWRERKKRVFKVFDNYSDGIIATQEILPFQIKEILEEVPDLDVIYRSRTKEQDDGPANAIFYNKQKWQIADHETFWYSDTPDVPASKGWGNTLPRTGNNTLFIDTLSNTKVRIMNLQLDHRSEESREKTIDLVLDKLKRVPKDEAVFIVGDLRVRSNDPLIKRLKKDYKDTFEGKELDGCTYHEYHGGSHCPRYDYIFFRKKGDIEKTAYKIDKWRSKGHYPQDHYPVFASFKIKGSVN